MRQRILHLVREWAHQTKKFRQKQERALASRKVHLQALVRQTNHRRVQLQVPRTDHQWEQELEHQMRL